MPSNQTKNYQLSQWVKSDQVLMDDFNKDNEKLDAAVKAVDVRVDGKADQTALEKEISDRAAAVTEVKQTLSRHAADLTKLGNCQIEMSTYTGNSTCGPDNPTRINFPKRPLFFIVFGETVHGFGTRLASSFWSTNEETTYTMSASWSGNQFSFFGNRYDLQLNRSGYTYYVVAFYD